jgi:excisionase family DNA binding protein
MTTPTKTTPPSVDRLHSQGLQQNVVIVADPSDHHAHDDETIMRKLAEAVATGDRDAVFTIARRLVSGSTAVVAPTTTVEDRWLTRGEAAVYANVSRMTIWRWCNERGLAFTKVGSVVRIRSAVLRKFMEQRDSG